MDSDDDEHRGRDSEETQHGRHHSMTTLRARDVWYHLDPLGLSDLKNFRLIQFGMHAAFALLILMGLAEICFLAALLIRAFL